MSSPQAKKAVKLQPPRMPRPSTKRNMGKQKCMLTGGSSELDEQSEDVGQPRTQDSPVQKCNCICHPSSASIASSHHSLFTSHHSLVTSSVGIGSCHHLVASTYCSSCSTTSKIDKVEIGNSDGEIIELTLRTSSVHGEEFEVTLQRVSFYNLQYSNQYDRSQAMRATVN